MVFGALASDLIVLISKLVTLIGQGVRASTCGKVDRMSPLMLRAPATVLVAFGLAVFTHLENQRLGRIPALLSVGQKTSHIIQAFRSLDFQPEPASRILLKAEKRFYQNGYYPAFVAALIWNDHSLSIYVDSQEQAPVLSIGPLESAPGTLTEQQIATMDYIISFDEFQAELIRAPSRIRPNTSSYISASASLRFTGYSECRKTS